MLTHELPVIESKKNSVHPDEWTARLQLAACYRIFAMLGWTEMIYNHITLRLPDSVTGGEKQFLINPFGLHYSEVTASNLIKINLAGDTLDDSPYPVNPAGYTLHSTIHAGIEGAHCVMHTHTTAGVSVACLPGGLSQSNFYSAQLHDMVAYHAFEGITIHAEEGPRVLASMGNKPRGDPAQPRPAGLGPHAAAGFRHSVDPAAGLRDPAGHAQHGRAHPGVRGDRGQMHARRAAVQPEPRRRPGRVRRPGAAGGPHRRQLQVLN